VGALQLPRSIGDIIMGRRRAHEATRRRVAELRSAFLIEAKPATGPATGTLLGDAPMAAFAGAFLGCLTTECFNASGIMPCIASASATVLICGLLLVTRTTCLFTGAFFSALYGGTFAGMTPLAWISDSATGALSVTLSIVSGFVFYVVAKLDSRSAAPLGIGCGGRLGAIAIVASILFVELLRSLGVDTSRFHAVAADAFDVEPLPAIAAFSACLVGIFATLVVLRHWRAAAGSVPVQIFLASAAALLGLIVLHRGSPDDASEMEAFYAGCFLGMSTLDRLKGWFQPAFGAVVLIVLLVPVRAFLNGFGGGLGLGAFAAVLLLAALPHAATWTTRDTDSGDFARAIASVVTAACLLIGMILAEPIAEEVPISDAMTASEQVAKSSDATPVRLVVGRPAPSVGDNPIPISISLINAAADDFVVLSGLPPGAAMTNGRRLATGAWQLSAPELATAAVRAEKGFAGGAVITVELRRADQTIVDRQDLQLEWIGPPPGTTDVAGPPVAGSSIGQIPDAATEDDEALFREFLQSRGRAAPEVRGVPRVTRTAVRGQHVRSPVATSTGPRSSILPLATAAVRPPRPVRPPLPRGDLSSQQRKPPPRSALAASRQDRPTTVSAAP
jgi:hypothetical protein